LEPAGLVLDDRPRHLREYLRVLYKHRWLAGTCFAVIVCLTAVVTMLVPRRYTSWTRLQVARRSPLHLRLPDNLVRLDDQRDADARFVATQVAALQSRDLAERVIRGHGLGADGVLADLHGARPSLVSRNRPGMEELLRPRGWEEAAPADDGGAVPDH